MIIPYPTVEVKHIWQVYLISELKIKSVCFFPIRPMIWIFIAVKNRYLNLLVVLKFLKTQNEPKRVEKKSCNQQVATTIDGQFFLTMSTTRQILTIPLLKEFFSFISVTFVTRKWENKSASIELVTRSEIFYFLTSS